MTKKTDICESWEFATSDEIGWDFCSAILDDKEALEQVRYLAKHHKGAKLILNFD